MREQIVAAKLLGTVLVLSLTGCATTTPVLYSPQLSSVATGSVAVGDFNYLAAAQGKVGNKQIGNTAPLGHIIIDTDVSTYFSHALKLELANCGIGTDHGNTLTGDIVDFLIDDWGFRSDYRLVVDYRLQSADTVVYKATKVSSGRWFKMFLTSKFNDNVNVVIRENIRQLVLDAGFAKAIVANANAQ